LLCHPDEPFGDGGYHLLLHGELVLWCLDGLGACLVAVEHPPLELVHGHLSCLCRRGGSTVVPPSARGPVAACTPVAFVGGHDHGLVVLSARLEGLHLLFQLVLLVELLLLGILHEFPVHFAPVLVISGCVRLLVPVRDVSPDVSFPDLFCLALDLGAVLLQLLQLLWILNVTENRLEERKWYVPNVCEHVDVLDEPLPSELIQAGDRHLDFGAEAYASTWNGAETGCRVEFGGEQSASIKCGVNYRAEFVCQTKVRCLRVHEASNGEAATQRCLGAGSVNQGTSIVLWSSREIGHRDLVFNQKAKWRVKQRREHVQLSKSE
jgi:hypothetical protein